MSKMHCTQERFLDDVAKFHVSIYQDNGVYRHILFTEPQIMNHRFSLITWPWYLCIQGDMGTYVFSRTQDMFCFFRDYSLRINASYWHEKLVADSLFEGAEKYSPEVFENTVRSYFRDACIDDDIKLEHRRDVWEAIEEQVLTAKTEEQAYHFADVFYRHDFQFIDFWETDLKEYTYQFIWCLRAIVWGINQYDRYKCARNVVGYL